MNTNIITLMTNIKKELYNTTENYYIRLCVADGLKIVISYSTLFIYDINYIVIYMKKHNKAILYSKEKFKYYIKKDNESEYDIYEDYFKPNQNIIDIFNKLEDSLCTILST